MDHSAISRWREAYQNRTPRLNVSGSSFAVLAPLVNWNGQLQLLFEVRAASLRHHTSEVCFPGGQVEGGESPFHCALRETEEELSIPPSSVSLIAPLDLLYLRSDSLLHPFLAEVDAEAAANLICNPHEVASTFLVPLSFFMDNEPERFVYPLRPEVDGTFPYEAVNTPPDYRWQPGRMEVLVYRGLPHPLWGLTARVVDNLIRLLKE